MGKGRNNQTYGRQQRVGAAIQSVGGYWRPIAGVARLLEELGELSELLDLRPEELDLSHLSAELADIWIITTCTANQYHINLEDYEADATLVSPTTSTFNVVVSMAGRIARIVNYYDGPKNPRSFDLWPSLGPTVSSLHAALYRLAGDYAVDLDSAIDGKLGAMASIDGGRFPRSYDPSTADSLTHFEEIRSNTLCPFASTARLWGAPAWEQRRSLAHNVDLLLPYLTSFTKVVAHEQLDGFVIAIDDLSLTYDMCRLAKWFRRFLAALAKRDPLPYSLATKHIARPGWQFSLNGVRLFISVFSPLYPVNHPRHSDAVTFIILQPEISFDRCGIGSKYQKSRAIKKRVRDQFARAGKSYPTAVIEARIEASIYLPPRWEGDTCTVWW